MHQDLTFRIEHNDYFGTLATMLDLVSAAKTTVTISQRAHLFSTILTLISLPVPQFRIHFFSSMRSEPHLQRSIPWSRTVVPLMSDPVADSSERLVRLDARSACPSVSRWNGDS